MFNRLVFTGTGRSGTKSSAQLFTKLGFKTTHQEVYSGEGPKLHPERTGDSSGLAAPFVTKIHHETLVIHQVRDPMKTIKSLLRNNHVPQNPYNPKRPWDGKQIYAFFCPRLQEVETKFERACVLWTDWNQRVEAIKGQENYRFQRLEDYTPEILEEILTSLGVNWGPRLADVFHKHPKDVGTDRKAARFPKGVIPFDCQAWREFKVKAVQYGYSVSLDS